MCYSCSAKEYMFTKKSSFILWNLCYHKAKNQIILFSEKFSEHYMLKSENAKNNNISFPFQKKSNIIIFLIHSSIESKSIDWNQQVCKLTKGEISNICH